MAKCARNSKSMFSVPFLILGGLFFLLHGYGVAYGQEVESGTLNGIIQAQGKHWVAKDYPERKGLGAVYETSNILNADVSQQPSQQSMTTGTLPATFDWSNHTNPGSVSYVTPVKDQGGCGSCWAFSSVGALESTVLINNNMGGLNKNLSEQILVTFVYPPPSGDGCDGGAPSDAANFLQNTGVSLQTCYPYTGTDGSVSDACADWAGYLDKPSKSPTQTYKITGWSYVAQDETALKTALYNQGPLVVTMAVYDDFYSYSSGVYSYTSGGLDGYHAIELVGWDDTNQCFIVKNSWGTDWGENGFFRIAYSQLLSPVDFAYEAIAYTASTIADAPLPLADFYIQVPNTGSAITAGVTPPFTVGFHDVSVSPTPVTSWAYNFGDGVTSTQQNPSHQYTTPGIYTVTLEAGNKSGVDTTMYTDVVTVYGVNFTAAPTSGTAPLKVQFNNQAPGATSFQWSFGDGGTSTAASPSYTYTTAGTYAVTLTVVNPGGSLTTTKTGFITVKNPGAPIANMTATPTSGKPALAVQFKSTSTGTISSYSWNFGDSTTSTSQNPSHTYSNVGSYTATLTVTGPGGTSAKNTTITVALPPVANSTATPTSGKAPFAVQFTSTSTGTISSYLWNFGDGTTSATQNPSHNYTAAGNHPATLTVIGPGGTSTKTTTITVTPATPVADFMATPTSGKAPLAVQFISTSTGTITSYSWNFGDKTATSTAQSPKHTYTTAGTYTATLTVTGPGGASAMQTTITASKAVTTKKTTTKKGTTKKTTTKKSTTKKATTKAEE